jgi:hypothetical protein
MDDQQRADRRWHSDSRGDGAGPRQGSRLGTHVQVEGVDRLNRPPDGQTGANGVWRRARVVKDGDGVPQQPARLVDVLVAGDLLQRDDVRRQLTQTVADETLALRPIGLIAREHVERQHPHRIHHADATEGTVAAACSGTVAVLPESWPPRPGRRCATGLSVQRRCRVG